MQKSLYKVIAYTPISSFSHNIPREQQQLGDNQNLSLVKTLGEKFSMTRWSRGTTRTETEQLREEATPNAYFCKETQISRKVPAGRRDQSQPGLGSCTRGIRIA